MKGIEKTFRDLLPDFAEKKGESRQEYLKRLAKTADKLSDDDYEKLPDRSKEWLDQAAIDIKAGKKVVAEFADADEDDVAERFPAAKEDKKASKKAAKKAAESDDEDDSDDEGSEDDSDDEDSEDDSDDSDDEEEKPKAKAGKKTAKKVPAKKAEKPAKSKAKAEKKERKPKGPTPMSEYTKLRVKQPKAKRDDLLAKLKDKGFELSASSATSLDCHINLAFNEARRQKIDFSKDTGSDK